MWSSGPAFKYLLRTDHLLLVLVGVPLALWVLAFGVGRIGVAPEKAEFPKREHIRAEGSSGLGDK